MLAALNHPSIAAIYGLEKTPDFTALVMELVEGEDLSQRIARGAIPIDEALPIAKQIAEALEAAHEQGIIHRDLKPANIKVRADGTVKVLDFGLAKAMDPPAGSSPNVSQSPTITTPAMTQAGMILGTAAYMSPEQASGKPVDRRTDVWAFGCVLYEMLTGHLTFAGDTVSDVISGILRTEPDWTQLPADTPEPVRRLLALCLTKDAKERLPHIGLARIELASGRIASSSVALAPSAIASERTAVANQGRSAGFAWGVAGVAVLAALAGAGVSLWPRPAAPALGVLRFELPPPPGTERFGHNSGARGTQAPAPHYAVSPDGRSLAFVALEPSGPSLWLQSFEFGSARRLPGTEDASFPFWSPDGQAIAFFAQQRLKRVAPGDTRPVDVCAADAGEGGAWTADGSIYFAPTPNGGIWRVAALGGAPTQVTSPPATEFHRWPVLVDRDTRMLYLAALQGRSVLRLRDLARGTEVDVLDTPSRAMVSRGNLLFARDGQLWAQRFDEQRGALSGEPVRVAADVAGGGANSRAGFHVSAAGVLVHRSGADDVALSHLVWRDRAGRDVSTVGEPARYSRPAMSPKGDRLAIDVAGANNGSSDIWIVDLARGVRTRLTDGAGISRSPVWSPDGTEIVYSTGTSGLTEDLMLLGTGGAATPRQGPKGHGRPSSWVPGERAVLTTTLSRNLLAGSIQRVPLEAGAPVDVVTGPFNASAGTFSPDGRLIAYQSSESGSSEVYVQPWPVTSDKWRISTSGGAVPQWRPSGGELYYISPARDLMAVSVTRAAGSWRFGTPVRLFGGADRNFAAYAPGLDGQRFLTLRATGEATSSTFSPLSVTLNWQQLLPR